MIYCINKSKVLPLKLHEWCVVLTLNPWLGSILEFRGISLSLSHTHDEIVWVVSSPPSPRKTIYPDGEVCRLSRGREGEVKLVKPLFFLASKMCGKFESRRHPLLFVADVGSSCTYQYVINNSLSLIPSASSFWGAWDERAREKEREMGIDER